MAKTRVTGIASAATLQAKDANGAWRDLADGDEVFDQEEVFARADGPQFALNGYKLQRRSAAAWVDAVTVVLDAGSGSSHWRQDKFGIAGDATNSTVSLILTVAKACRQTAHDLAVLQVMQTDVGGRFSYPAKNGAKFYGCFSGVERTSDLAMGGFQEGIDAQIVTDREQWALAGQPAGPVVGQEVLWHDDASTRRIVKVETDEISFVVSLASINK